MVLNWARNLNQEISRISCRLTAMQEEISETKILAAKYLINQIKSQGVYDNIQDAEFKVFSQFGDDGIIQYLINNVIIDSPRFIEFGVENYTESNTRFLLINNNWSGLVMDGSKANVDYIKRDSIYWKYDLTAVDCFIDKDNINEIISENDFSGDVGILSIDIDGNDYWIWECINVVSPAIVIVEYNSVFGAQYAVTVPYDPIFNRTLAHPSNLFWGCSLRALYLLAEKKDYAFVGCNSAGNNAYFVRKDKLGDVKPLGIESGYVQSKFRESRDKEGRLSYVRGDKRIILIEEMVIYDVGKERLVRIRDL